MGMHQVSCVVNRRTIVKSVRGRIYRAGKLHPEPIPVWYRQNESPNQRYVMATDLMSDPNVQSYVHDTIISITHRRTLYKFRVFFKRHKLLPVNQAIQELAQVRAEGDVLLVACGKDVNIRNLRGRVEEKVADRAVQKFMQHLHPLRTQRHFPADMQV